MSERTMDIQSILEYLPHRPPFLLVDRVLKVIPGKSIHAIKNVTVDEWFFAGHFPGHPIMPGVLILEALAQASTILGFASLDERPQAGDLYLFAGIDAVRFRRMVCPGDQLHLQVEIMQFRKNALKVRATALVDGEVVCTAELMSVRKGAPKNE